MFRDLRACLRSGRRRNRGVCPFRVLGFRNVGLRIWGFGLTVWGLGLRAWGSLGFWAYGLGLRVWGPGCKVQGSRGGCIGVI